MIRASPNCIVGSSMRRCGGGSLQSVRSAHVKRTLAWPTEYKAEAVPLTHPKKDHSSSFNRQLKSWLGPRNVRGEYFRNKYYYPPQNHTPNYIVPDGQSVVSSTKSQVPSSRYRLNGRNPSLHPFPTNLACKTASIIPNNLKDVIYQRVAEEGVSPHVIANDYKIKVDRVEAIVTLAKVEKRLRQENKISKDAEKFSQIMYRMFPLFSARSHSENLTEIPIPRKTLQQRFLSISESEPFGPVDAAKVLGLEPASETLQNITKHTHDEEQQKHHKVVMGESKKGDKVDFKFIQAKSGNVGFRYGASRRDRKKDRAVSFDKEGRMVYTP